MTLAATILFFAIVSLTSVDPRFVTQSVEQSDSSANAPATSSQTPSDQPSPGAKTPPSDGTSSAPSSTAKQKASVKKKRIAADTKAATDPNCDPVPAKSGSAESSQQTAPPQTGGAQASPNAEPPKNCPPPKTVVREGGITEQGIQLAGGSSGGEATQKRQSTHQMLTATEENLKKAASIQLSTEQQGSVSQIRQFITQSKSALKAADYERAHTLAWKAKVLSDDLVNPKK
jgi:hypothetical protein